ncbi:protein of unknown function [Kushneria avicenniae]|uniref:Uncharacterized protein n=1 Tax=Kushneria avicenniae TaxID=402385 RepID=A0A1I1N3K0_9GAMM|nr:DUF4123 domain-containing protein [Kushneria avicenniae]SFC92221.1 protein of unknown function [Kushneria avicenniae]
MSLHSIQVEKPIEIDGLLQQFNYALVNPLIVHERDWRDLPIQALETSPAPARPHRLPQLIDLTILPDEKHEVLAERIRRYQLRGTSFFSALIMGGESFNDMSYHLRRQLLQKRPGDRRHYWFRYYDPLVFRHLPWLLTPKQMARLLGPIELWSWPDGVGQWRSLTGSGEKPVIHWLELTRIQWATIDRFATLNQSLRRLAMIAPDWPQNEAHWRWLDNMLRHGQEAFGLSVEHQQYLAERAAQYHPALETHPVIQKFLTQASQGNSSLASHLDQLTDAEWKIIVSELEEQA